MFGSPAFMLKQKTIMQGLKAHGAVSEETAATLEEAGVINPDAFPKVTEDLINKGKIVKTDSGKYYVSEGAL